MTTPHGASRRGVKSGGKLPGVAISRQSRHQGPLPRGASGIEFWTSVAPHSLSHPTRVWWYEHDPGVEPAGEDYVKIAVIVTRNTQV